MDEGVSGCAIVGNWIVAANLRPVHTGIRLRDSLRRRIQQLVNQRLIRLSVFARDPTKFYEQGWSNSNRNELLGLPRLRSPDALGTHQLLAGRFGNVRKIKLTIRHMPCADLLLPESRWRKTKNQTDDPAYAVRSLRLGLDLGRRRRRARVVASRFGHRRSSSLRPMSSARASQDDAWRVGDCSSEQSHAVGGGSLARCSERQERGACIDRGWRTHCPTAIARNQSLREHHSCGYADPTSTAIPSDRSCCGYSTAHGTPRRFPACGAAAATTRRARRLPEVAQLHTPDPGDARRMSNPPRPRRPVSR